jgi:hypothetical protein
MSKAHVQVATSRTATRYARSWAGRRREREGAPRRDQVVAASQSERVTNQNQRLGSQSETASCGTLCFIHVFHNIYHFPSDYYLSLLLVDEVLPVILPQCSDYAAARPIILFLLRTYLGR